MFCIRASMQSTLHPCCCRKCPRCPTPQPASSTRFPCNDKASEYRCSNLARFRFEASGVSKFSTPPPGGTVVEYVGLRLMLMGYGSFSAAAWSCSMFRIVSSAFDFSRRSLRHHQPNNRSELLEEFLKNLKIRAEPFFVLVGCISTRIIWNGIKFVLKQLSGCEKHQGN